MKSLYESKGYYRIIGFLISAWKKDNARSHVFIGEKL